MINVYSVRNHLEKEGWFLLSNEYRNLKEPLKMKCPKGHPVHLSYGEWRKNMSCPHCEAARPKATKRPIPAKTPEIYRVLGLDAATNTTGYSIYDNGQLVSWGVFKTDGKQKATARINEFKKWLISFVEEIDPDFVGIEHIHLQSFRKEGQSFNNYVPQQVELYRVLANLQGVIMDTLYELEKECDLVRPSTWRSYSGINNGDPNREHKKKAAQAKVKSEFKIDCTEDEADAICIGKYFAKHSSNYWENEAEVWGEW